MSKTDKIKYFQKINSDISFFIRNRQFSKALLLIEESLKENYDPYLLVSKAHIFLISSNNDEEKINEAEEILNTVLTLSSISFLTKKYALSELGRLASMRNDQLSSLDYYKQIIEESTDVESNTRCKVASLYCELEMYSHALAVIDVNDYNDELMNITRCRIFIQQKKFKLALEALKKPIVVPDLKKITFDKKMVECKKNYYLGCIYHSYNGDFKVAIKYFQLAMKDISKYDNMYWLCVSGLISSYYFYMQYDKCIELCNLYLEKASQDLKKYPRIVKTLVKVYCTKKDYDKALEIARKYNLSELELYVKASMKISNFDFISAYELLNQIDTMDDGLEVEICYKKLVILFRLNRVKEFNELYNDFVIMSNNSKHMSYEVKSMKISLSKDYNIEFGSDLDNYYGKQIINYSEEDYRNYIKDNFTYKFNKDINLDEVLDYVKKQVEVMNPICDGFYDFYSIPYRNVGITQDGKSVHNLLVKCLPDSKNVILVIPNDFKKDKDMEIGISSKQKRMSQIEKFNKRYGNI